LRQTVFEVQGGFKWPHFVLTAAILSEVDLLFGDEKEARFKMYNTVIRTWTKVRIGHVVTLKDGDHIFLKGHDVVLCQDFDRLLSGSQERKPHFSKNLRQERAHIRQALKEKKVKGGEKASFEDEDDDHDSDSDIMEGRFTQATHIIPTRPLVIPQRFKTEPSDFNGLSTFINDDSPTQSPTRVNKVKMEPMVIDLTISDSEDETIPATITRKRARSQASRFSSSPSPSPSLSLGHSGDDDELIWPSDFYVVDIVQGFKKCEAARRSRTSVEEAFFKCFKVPFRSTTFYNHRRHWENASQACRDEALRGGRSSAGSWKAFLKNSRSNKSSGSSTNVIERKSKKTKSGKH
jgi:hypothetical protein